MRYLLIKNKKKIKNIYNFEFNKILYKYIMYNCNLPQYIRQNILLNKDEFITNVSLRHRCVITNRSRSVFKHFKLSRIKLRMLYANGFINGLKKVS